MTAPLLQFLMECQASQVASLPCHQGQMVFKHGSWPNSAKVEAPDGQAIDGPVNDGQADLMQSAAVLSPVSECDVSAGEQRYKAGDHGPEWWSRCHNHCPQCARALTQKSVRGSGRSSCHSDLQVHVLCGCAEATARIAVQWAVA